MPKRVQIIGIYLLGILIFPFSWLREQPHAIRMAYWNSIGPAHEHAKRLAETDNA